MKTRINLTVEEKLVSQIKAYAEKNQTSVSDLVEEYFKRIIKPVKKHSVIDIIEGLKQPAIDNNADLKKTFYEDQSKKYGF